MLHGQFATHALDPRRRDRADRAGRTGLDDAREAADGHRSRWRWCWAARPGNIRDRSVYGYVIDYADFHFGTFRPFLIFNIADAAITIGVLIILARSLFLREKRNPTSDTPSQDEPAPNVVDPAAETN